MIHRKSIILFQNILSCFQICLIHCILLQSLRNLIPCPGTVGNLSQNVYITQWNQYYMCSSEISLTQDKLPIQMSMYIICRALLARLLPSILQTNPSFFLFLNYNQTFRYFEFYCNNRLSVCLYLLSL